MSKKIQITITDELEIWCREQAKSLGLSVSGICNIAISQYKEQKEIIVNMPKMLDMLGTAMKMKQMEDKK